MLKYEPYWRKTIELVVNTFCLQKNKLMILTVVKKIKAEVYISLEMMNENAKNLKQEPENETVRLISHALFHCMGYSDKSTSEKSKIRKMENSFINDVSRETIDNV